MIRANEEITTGFLNKRTFPLYTLSSVCAEVVPVVSPVASEEGTGHPLNVNADLAAAALAKAIGAQKLIYLSDVLGLMRDPADRATLVHTVSRASIEAMIQGSTDRVSAAPGKDAAAFLSASRQ